MRVTFNMRGMQMKEMLSTSLNNLNEAQRKVYAQQSLIDPWKDTTKYVGAYGVQNMIDELTQFNENAQNASNWLNNSDNELKQLVEALKKARNDFAIAGASDTYDEESRKALAKDVQSLYNQIMDIANANYTGRYIFGGYQTGKPPFDSSTNSIKNVLTKNANGENLKGDVNPKEVFTDMTELKSGRYKAEVTVSNGIATVRLFDEKGNIVIMDSNGSDEAGGQGNSTTTSLTFPYEPGKVINTGRGVSFKMPEDLAVKDATSVTMEFDYKSGSQVTYKGDNGYINAQIGYNQDITMNMPGSNIFTQSNKLIQGSKVNTVNGQPATPNTPFGKLDGVNISNGDSIKVSGTDHNGNKVGTANVLSPSNPSLNLANASEKERTLTVTYGDKLYKIVVPQKAYATEADLANAINGELKNAEYLGALGDLKGANANIRDYASTVNSAVNSGNYPGTTTIEDRNKYTVDLSNQIQVSADGSRIQFTTNKAGDNVRLAVTGTDQSLVGFKNQTIAAEGKDTTFELGYDFHSETIKPIETTHTNKDLQGDKITVFVNGKEVTITKPETEISFSPVTIVQGQDIEMNVNGRKIVIPWAEYDAVPQEERQQFVRDSLTKAGLNGEAAIAAWNDQPPTPGFTLFVASPSKKEIEYEFDKALRQAGFDFGVSVRLSSNSQEPRDLGNFNVTFSLNNYNAEKDSVLTTTFYDTETIPATSDMKTASVDKTSMIINKDKTLGDYVKFIENLYDYTVDVSIEDGKLSIRDTRGGDSKLSFRTISQNQGIGHAIDRTNVVSGAYTGKYDDEWTFTVTTELGLNNQRNISITVVDKQGNLVYNGVTPDYKGGPIQLPNGVNITPNDMNLPDPADPNKRTETQKFTVELKKEPAVSFGDMNVVETGKNVNIFKSLDNLIHALEHNISKNGFGEPSAWKAEDLKSTAKPYLGGTFQGNFNDNWKYEILGKNDKNKFYLQNEYKSETGKIQFTPDLITGDGRNTPLKFSVDIYDNKTGKQQRVDVNIDLSKATPALTDAKSAQEYILKELNNKKEFVDAGIKFTNKDGKIEIQSGSGTKIANFANSATNRDERALATHIMGFETMANGKLEEKVTITANATYMIDNPTGDPRSIELTLEPKTNAETGQIEPYTQEELVKTINGILSPEGEDPSNISASIKDGKLVFIDSKTEMPVTTSVPAGIYNPLKIAMEHNEQGNYAEMLVSGVQTPKTDLSETSEEERTLTFKYVLNGEQKTATITLDKKAYTDAQDIADNINSQLAKLGITTAQLKAGVNANGEISFIKGADFTTVTVEGDYAGTLGFPKAGDSVDIKVTNAKGELVQNVSLETANQTVYVSDGLQLGFNAGSLSATDSFTAAIGSGMEAEAETLQSAIDQVLAAATIVGTRGQRVKSVTKFQETVIASNEQIKAGYLGSSPQDVIKLSTDVKLAESAYQSAMALTGSMLRISILDFLR